MAASRLVILGAPGAGKGTQCKRLVDEFGLAHVTTGDALRANKDMVTEYGTPRSYMDEGELVPDPVVNEIVESELEAADGFVLDGYPRNQDQAAYLDSITDLDGVLYLAVDEDVLVGRLTGRRVCSDCGANYHAEFNPPVETGTCDECGGDLYHREDDQEETARERLRVYEENTQPLIEFYRNRGELIEIDGEQSIEAVWEDVKDAVRSTGE
jgi:adenylate kinase